MHVEVFATFATIQFTPTEILTLIDAGDQCGQKPAQVIHDMLKITIFSKDHIPNEAIPAAPEDLIF